MLTKTDNFHFCFVNVNMVQVNFCLKTVQLFSGQNRTSLNPFASNVWPTSKVDNRFVVNVECRFVKNATTKSVDTTRITNAACWRNFWEVLVPTVGLKIRRFWFWGVWPRSDFFWFRMMTPRSEKDWTFWWITCRKEPRQEVHQILTRMWLRLVRS